MHHCYICGANIKLQYELVSNKKAKLSYSQNKTAAKNSLFNNFILFNSDRKQL